MNTTSYNPLLVAKLLDRAGHPNTFDNEALVAVRKAYTACTKAGMTLADAVVVDADIFFKLSTVPVRAYLARIVDLEEADAAKDARIAELEAANAVLAAADAAKDARLAEREARIATLEAAATKNAIVDGPAALAIAQQDVARAEPPASKEMKAEANEDINARADVDGSERVCELQKKMRWTRRAKARFAAYISAGMSKARIATLIACEFLAAVSTADISAMMRARWLPDADGYLWAS